MNKEDKVLMQNQIKDYQNEILKLEKRRKQLLIETENEIVKEKELWEKQKEKLIKKAHDKGYQDGLSIGKQEGLRQYNDLINQANEIIKRATKDYHNTIEESEEMIIGLAIYTAEKVLEQKINGDPEQFLSIVSTAIKEIKDQSTISIYLHPNNYEFVVQQKDELVETLDGDTKLSIYIDQELNENDCIIEHPFGQIDASVDTQLNQIRSALVEFVLENRQ